MSACITVGELLGGMLYGIAYLLVLVASLSALSLVEAWRRKP